VDRAPGYDAFPGLAGQELTALAVVEHYRNLWNFVRVIHEKEDDGNSICNPMNCPRMSAGT